MVTLEDELQSGERMYVCFWYLNPSGSGLDRIRMQGGRERSWKEMKTKVPINNSLHIDGLKIIHLCSSCSRKKLYVYFNHLDEAYTMQLCVFWLCLYFTVLQASAKV